MHFLAGFHSAAPEFIFGAGSVAADGIPHNHFQTPEQIPQHPVVLNVFFNRSAGLDYRAYDVREFRPGEVKPCSNARSFDR
jgi:hypothetical protein